MKQQQQSPRPAGTFAPIEDLNIGDCRNVTWGEMWLRFRATYEGRDRYSEMELKRIHDKWKRLTREIETGG